METLLVPLTNAATSQGLSGMQRVDALTNTPSISRLTRHLLLLIPHNFSAFGRSLKTARVGGISTPTWPVTDENKEIAAQTRAPMLDTMISILVIVINNLLGGLKNTRNYSDWVLTLALGFLVAVLWTKFPIYLSARKYQLRIIFDNLA